MRIVLLAFLIMFAVPAFAETDPALQVKQAEQFIRQLGDDAISSLEKTKGDETARRAEFDRILNKNFDMDRIAKFALGRYWNAADKAEQKEYTKLFKNMVVDVYNRRFSEYSGEEFKVTGAKPAGRKDMVVNSKVVGSGQPIRVDWRVRNGKVIDVIVEGVSMSVTQRNDFAAIIQRNGGTVSSLIDHLKNS